MKIVSEHPPRLCLPKDTQLSYLCHNKNCWYALEENNDVLYTFKEAGYDQIKLQHQFKKLLFIEKNSEYIALYQHPTESKSGLYLLDLYLNETDFLPLATAKKNFYAIDVAVSQTRNCILALSKNKLCAFNTNADSLGVLMYAPKGRCYKALCTYEGFIFIVYEVLNCLYLAVYDSNCCFIDKVSIGSEYTIKNIQIIKKHSVPMVQLFLYKNGKFPVIIQIELEGKCHNPTLSSSKISLEQYSDEKLIISDNLSCPDENLKPSCNVGCNDSQILPDDINFSISEDSYEPLNVTCNVACLDDIAHFDDIQNIIY